MGNLRHLNNRNVVRPAWQVTPDQKFALLRKPGPITIRCGWHGNRNDRFAALTVHEDETHVMDAGKPDRLVKPPMASSIITITDAPTLSRVLIALAPRHEGNTFGIDNLTMTISDGVRSIILPTNVGKRHSDATAFFGQIDYVSREIAVLTRVGFTEAKTRPSR